jgi:tetratricopeptide (TPR) repeat protein
VAMEEMHLSKIDAKVEELAFHFKNSDDNEKAVFYLNKAGDKAQSLYAFSNAVNYFRDCIDILEKLEPDKSNRRKINLLAEIYCKIEFPLSTIGKRKEAQESIQEALYFAKKAANKDTESLALFNIGCMYGDIGKWEEAIKYLEESLIITEKIGNLKRKARIIKNIGLAKLFKGDPDEGYEYLKESLKICEEIKALDIYSMVLNNIGIYYDMLGKWKKAIEVYKESLSIAKKIKNIIVISNIMNNIGFAYSSLEETKQAIYYLKESAKIADKIGDIYNKGINYIHLGEEYLRKDKFKEVRYYISHAEKIFNEIDDKLGLADIFKLKGVLSKKLKDWESSNKYFKRSIKIYYQQGDRLNEGETYYEWGNMLILKKDMNLAKKKLLKSKIILESIGAKKHLKEIEKKLNNLKK